MIEAFSEEAKNLFKFKNIPRRYLYHKILRITIILLRRIGLPFFKVSKKYINFASFPHDFSINIENLLTQKLKYKSEGYSYGDKLISNSFLIRLLSDWPPILFFKPKAEVYKSYDTAMWLSNSDYQFKLTIKSKSDIKYFPYIKKLFIDLNDPKFLKAIKVFCDDKIDRELYSFVLTQASEGSGLIQHKDGISLNEKFGDSFLNLIIFLDGSDPPLSSGGTGIYLSANPGSLKECPKSLKNSFLIYKSSRNIYHGFKPMKKNKYRKAILVQFADKRLATKKN